MTDAAINPAAPPALAALRAKIGWLCHLIRLAALIYAGWVLFIMVRFYSDKAAIIKSAAVFYGKNIEAFSAWQYGAICAIAVVGWSMTAWAVYCVWRLISGYLNGSIFTVEAAIWLRRIGYVGFLATLFDLGARPLQTLILTAHLPPDDRVYRFFFTPLSLLHLLFFAGLFALAYVFKTAAEIADDNSRIV